MSILKICFIVVQLLISIGLPLTLSFILYKKYKVNINIMLIGVFMWLLYQIILREYFILEIASYKILNIFYSNIIIFGIFFAVATGVIEEGCRYIGLKIGNLFKQKHKIGIAYGIGHGGVESIFLVGLVSIQYLFLSLSIEEYLLFHNHSLIDLKKNLLNTPTIFFLVSGLERLMRLIIQIAYSLFMLNGIKNKRRLRYLMVVFIHVLIDAPIIWFLQFKNSILLSESYLLIWSIIGLYYISYYLEHYKEKKLQMC